MTRSNAARTAVASVALVAFLGLGILPANALPVLPGPDSISVGSNPYNVVFTPDGLRAYVTNVVSDNVSVIDAGTNTKITDIAVGDYPKGVAVSPDGSRVYVSNRNAGTVSVINTATNTVINTLTVSGSPESIAFTKDGAEVWVANANSYISIINVPGQTVSSPIALPNYPEGIAISPDGARALVALPGSDKVLPITVSTRVLGTPITVGDLPNDIAFTIDGAKALVTNSGSDSVSVITMSSLTTTSTITVGDSPQQVAVSADGSTAYVSNFFGGTSDVSVIKLGTMTLGDGLAAGGNPQGVATNPHRDQLYIANFNGAQDVSAYGFGVSRVSGADRYATAVEISKATFPTGGADVVYVSTGANFPDALAAGPIAAAHNGVLLLTPSDSLPSTVSAEITRLGATDIVVVGGEKAVSPTVFNQLQALPGSTTRRIAGANRYETGRALLADAFPPGSGSLMLLYVATGRDFPDALSAGATGSFVMLVDGKSATVDQATLDLISGYSPGEIKVVGGPAAVSDGIVSQLNANWSTHRVSGADRYSTSLAIVDDAFSTGSSSTALLATGTGFADALAGTPYAGAIGAPLLVVHPDCIPAATLDSIAVLDATRVTLLGGQSALNQNVFNLGVCA